MSVFSDKELFIFDMDGTIYLGNDIFPFAVKLIDKLREKNKKVLFFTNNSSRSKKTHIQKLINYGFGARDDEVITSGNITVEFIKKYRPGKKVFLIGTKDLEEEFVSDGIEISDDADIVVSSFDTELTYSKLKVGCRLIKSGAEYFCTHIDFNCPTEKGVLPDSGSIASLITAATGVKPRFFGKPFKDSADIISEKMNIPLEKMVVFGDRLYTDIAFGKLSGITAVLVLTGEARIEDVIESNEDERPDFIFKSLDDVINLI